MKRPTHVAFLGPTHAIYEELPPPPELAPWVAVFWRIRCRDAFTLPVLPDGCMDIIGDDIVGSLSQPVYAEFGPGGSAQGVRFHPGGLPALVGVPASELVDLRVPVTDVVPAFTSLADLARTAPTPDPVGRLVACTRDLAIVRRETSYSERHIRRRVLAATGHSPKRLIRILRMQDVLRHDRTGCWASTAVEHGYYDEAHMANDIRDLAGATPHALLSRQPGD